MSDDKASAVIRNEFGPVQDLVSPVTGEVFEGPDAVEVSQRRPFRIAFGRYMEKLGLKRQTPNGEEMPDPVPMQPPLGYIKQPSMIEHVRNMIRSEQLRQEALAAGFESFEEADDFDVPDEIEPISAYEFERNFDPAPDGRATPQVAPQPAPVPAPAETLEAVANPTPAPS